MISYYVVSITVLLWKILREVQLSLSYYGVYRQDKNWNTQTITILYRRYLSNNTKYVIRQYVIKC